YYASLDAYVRAHGSGMVVLNPGTATSECYMAAGDVLVTFEGDVPTYRTSYSAPAWAVKYAPPRFWHIVYGAGGPVDAAQVVSSSRTRGAGLVYVTDRPLPNPYSGLPGEAVWTSELSADRQLTAPPAPSIVRVSPS